VGTAAARYAPARVERRVRDRMPAMGCKVCGTNGWMCDIQKDKSYQQKNPMLEEDEEVEE
jgi:hypothetical protein